MTEDWGDIDGGWEDVDVEKKKRTRARGKQRRITSGQPALQQQPRKRPKTHNHPPVQSADAATKKQAQGRPWLLPVLGFVVVLGILVLALLATKS